MGNMLTDGARVYVTQCRPEGLVLEQVSATGGETSAIPSPIKNMWMDDISPDHSQLLVGSFKPQEAEKHLSGPCPYLQVLLVVWVTSGPLTAIGRLTGDKSCSSRRLTCTWRTPMERLPTGSCRCVVRLCAAFLPMEAAFDFLFMTR